MPCPFSAATCLYPRWQRASNAGLFHVGISQRSTMKSHALNRAAVTSDPGTYNGVFSNNAVGALLASFLTRNAHSSGSVATSNRDLDNRTGKSLAGTGNLLSYGSGLKPVKKAGVGASGLITILVLISIAIHRYNLPAPPATSTAENTAAQNRLAIDNSAGPLTRAGPGISGRASVPGVRRSHVGARHAYSPDRRSDHFLHRFAR
jgi:hypothetical protein